MTVATKTKWVSVSRTDTRQCPVCGSRSWCTVSSDGKTVHCMRVESAKACPGGMGGWIHSLENVVDVPRPREPKKVKDVTSLAMKLFTDKLAAQKRESLSRSLGVSVESLFLLRVGIGWDHDGREFASFPCRDAGGRVVGITRRYGDGEKKTMAGTSNSGIFVVEKWWLYPGPVVVVEGASDVAALVTHSFCALGRPSNVGGGKVLRAYLRRRGKGRMVVVVGENDAKPEKRGKVSTCPPACAGCSWCWPGKYGAQDVARQLGCAWRCVPPCFKDARGWSLAELDFRGAFGEWLDSR